VLSPGCWALQQNAMPVGGATGLRYCRSSMGAGATPARCCFDAGEAVDGERLAEAEMITADEESSISWMMCRLDRNAVREESLRRRDE